MDQPSDSRILADYDLSCCIKVEDNNFPSVKIPEQCDNKDLEDPQALKDPNFLSSILSTSDTCELQTKPNICNCFEDMISVEQFYETKIKVERARFDTRELIRFLKTAMYIGIIGLAYPLQLLMTFIFSKLTNRPFVWRIIMVFDLIVAFIQVIWMVYDYRL